MTQNLIVDAAIAAASMGTRGAAAFAEIPSGGMPSLAPGVISGRHANKFQMGWLGGVGNDSQFQGANRLLPVKPPVSNDDLESRIRSSRGLSTGGHLMTRWERPGNFNPGVGTDTWRDGQNVTWTLDHNGLQDVTTGLVAPVVYPTEDRKQAREAMPPFNARSQGLDGNQMPPIPVFGTPSGFQAGLSLFEMQQQARQAFRTQQLRESFRARAASASSRGGRR